MIQKILNCHIGSITLETSCSMQKKGSHLNTINVRDGRPLSKVRNSKRYFSEKGVLTFHDSLYYKKIVALLICFQNAEILTKYAWKS